MQERRQAFARVPEVAAHFADEEVHRLFREPAAQLRDALEDDFGQWPERAGVEIADRWVEHHGGAGLGMIEAIGKTGIQFPSPNTSRKRKRRFAPSVAYASGS